MHQSNAASLPCSSSYQRPHISESVCAPAHLPAVLDVVAYCGAGAEAAHRARSLHSCTSMIKDPSHTPPTQQVLNDILCSHIYI
jgi:hypothetical protein